MDVFRSLEGMVRLEVLSADPIAFLRLIQVPVYDVERVDALQYRFSVSRQDVKCVRRLADRRGETIKKVEIRGIYWLLKGLLKRPVLVLGLGFLLAVSLWVPGRVFFVQVEGNVHVPALQIIEKAQSCGIGFGASRREVRSEIIKNNLLSAMPELQWAGVNTRGCVAVITVKEREDPEKEQTEGGVSSIVAVRDGIVEELTVEQGSALVKPGQAVKAGQVLISGYTDCGLYIRAQQAKGEVYGQTQREISAVFPTEYALRTEKTASSKKITLVIGKKRINFVKGSGISGGSCAKIVSNYSLVLPGGFSLPVMLVVEEVFAYETAAVQPEGREALQRFGEAYLRSQMIAGQILHAGLVYTDLEGGSRLDGIYSCRELLGIQRKEENVLDYGKSD